MDLKSARFLKEISEMELQKKASVLQFRISHAERGLIVLRRDEKERIERTLDLVGAIRLEEHGANKTMRLSTVNFCTNAQTREIVWEGKRYLVAPVVALKVGVHLGSHGIPTFYPKEELAKFPEAWNGRPVPIQHPVKNGFPISANDPAIIQEQSVGQLWPNLKTIALKPKSGWISTN